MIAAISVQDVHLRYRNSRASRKPSAQREVLKGISFEVPSGEVLGIIGANGSGKSTLMRVLAGLMSPDSGRIELYGNTISLLALGVGFNNDLSGRDNIYLSGILLGYSKAEIDRKYDDIADFSELKEFLDQPVRTYSSGMRSKLSFAIAVNLKTDILLIDEVFSVGDIRFRNKSKALMQEMIRENDLTVLLVSHNLSEIQKMCSRVLWLDNGTVRGIGNTEPILEQYYQSMADDMAYLTYLDIPCVTVTSGEGVINIRWEAIENASDYRVYRKEYIKGSHWSYIADRYEGLSLADTPPSDQIEYLYTVRARAFNGRRDVWSEFIPSNPIRLIKQ